MNIILIFNLIAFILAMIIITASVIKVFINDWEQETKLNFYFIAIVCYSLNIPSAIILSINWDKILTIFN